MRGSCTWLALIVAITLSAAAQNNVYAGSATWDASPATSNWNHAANWTPQTVPNESTDTATFATSNKTGVSLSANTEVNGIVFNSGASAFSITAGPSFTFTISGVGITNNSGVMQNFVVTLGIVFSNSATAGSLTAFTNNGGTVSGRSGGNVTFLDTATAGNGTFTNNGGTVSGANGGFTQFFASSTAGSATITNNGGTFSGAFGGGLTDFTDTSTAGNGTFITNGSANNTAVGGEVEFNGFATAGNGTFITNGGPVSGARGGFLFFFERSTAGNATLIANGGVGGGLGASIRFFSTSHTRSHGGTARVEVFGNGIGDSTNGNLDISLRTNTKGVTIGSIEGSGAVFLGANKLTVGSNNLSTTFSGVIQDGGIDGGTGGSLAKVGKGKLTFTTANTYTGGTTINKGTLIAENNTSSATGSGAVQVNSGTLGGTGIINGAVTVGNGMTAGAKLQPGVGTTAGTVSINNTVSFNATSGFECYVNRLSTPVAGKLKALGITIGTNVSFTLVETGTTMLTPGTVFTVINNTSANPIFGTFSNLADGSTFSSGGNTFKANYEGGTGNDLTLTVQ